MSPRIVVAALVAIALLAGAGDASGQIVIKAAATT
jgi:hypothetical protein